MPRVTHEIDHRHLFGTGTLPSAASHVARVRKLFPDRAEDVSRLALRNETFRSLCEEYGLASDALDLLEADEPPPGRREDA